MPATLEISSRAGAASTTAAASAAWPALQSLLNRAHPRIASALNPSPRLPCCDQACVLCLVAAPPPASHAGSRATATASRQTARESARDASLGLKSGLSTLLLQYSKLKACTRSEFEGEACCVAVRASALWDKWTRQAERATDQGATGADERERGWMDVWKARRLPLIYIIPSYRDLPFGEWMASLQPCLFSLGSPRKRAGRLGQGRDRAKDTAMPLV